MDLKYDQRYFYAFGNRDGTEIKIGGSQHPKLRKRDLERNRTRDGELLDDLFFWRGWTHKTEEALKQKLISYRSRPELEEYYRPDPEILDWLRFMLQQPFTGSSAEVKDIQELPVCDVTDDWFPFAGEHSVARPTTPLGFPVQPPQEGHLATTVWADLLTDAVQQGDYYLPQEEANRIHEMWKDEPFLDVASCKAANAIIKARPFYGAHQMGQFKPWMSRTYANPPFNLWPDFYAHLRDELNAGRAKEILCVYPMDKLGTAGGQTFLRTANAACFKKGEVVFGGPLISKRKQMAHLQKGAYKAKRKTDFRSDGHCQTSGRLRIVYFFFGKDVSTFSAVYAKAGCVVPLMGVMTDRERIEIEEPEDLELSLEPNEPEKDKPENDLNAEAKQEMLMFG